MVGVDSTFLSLLLHPIAKAPDDPNTGLPIERLDERIDCLIEKWSERRETVIIPTPVLCEFLILANEDGPEYLTRIHDSSNFKVKPFDERAAIELAAIHVIIAASRSNRAVKRGDEGGTWAKIKFDRQIVAIAKVNNATAIYSDDKNLGNFAESMGIKVIRTWELPLPPPQQPTLFKDEKQTVESIIPKLHNNSGGNGENESEEKQAKETVAQDIEL